MAEARPTKEDIRREVLEYLAEFTRTPQVLDAPHDVLLSDCGLDSFATFEFVLGLEPRFGIVIDDKHFNARLLRSVDGVVEMVATVHGQAGSGPDRPEPRG
ncbi:acyl carrier protein [Microbispora cellulosiformans]|uniref:Acyl carrier protein n=1 Tax=Microbispora cellulosiformans TaxID=2614688 RepID=A0A5J5K9T7_9ACTN|nr:acyl carrier protein [Microbispora cellulosiformans]KAA9381405.1 acyl carrier protein [Microbispora cellulosiformans]